MFEGAPTCERRGDHGARPPLRASGLQRALGQANNPDWKTVAIDETGRRRPAQRRIGFRWGPDGRADQASGTRGQGGAPRQPGQAQARCSRRGAGAEDGDVGFPYFGGIASEHFPHNEQSDVLVRGARAAHPTRQGATSARRSSRRCSTCRSPTTASRADCGRTRGEGLRRRHALHAGLAGAHHRRRAQQLIAVARQFAENAARPRARRW